MKRTFAAVASLFTCFLVILILGALCVQAQTTGVSGLNVGDRFTFSNTYTWTSSIPGDIIPSALVAQNDSMLQVTVQNVTGSTVTLLEVWTYTNGSQIPAVEYAEVNSGLTGSVLAYAANLTAGQPLFPAATGMPAINDSLYRTYEGNARLTNHIEVNNTGISGENYSYMNLYFDQATGICVEYTLTTVYTDAPNQVVVQHLVLTYSSVWQVSSATSEPTVPVQTNTANPTASPTSNGSSGESSAGFPTDLIIIVAIVVAVIVVAGFFLLPKGKPKPKKEQEKPAEPQEPSAAEEEPWEEEEVREEAPKETPEEEKSEGDSYSI